MESPRRDVPFALIRKIVLFAMATKAVGILGVIGILFHVEFSSVSLLAALIILIVAEIVLFNVQKALKAQPGVE